MDLQSKLLFLLQEFGYTKAISIEDIFNYLDERQNQHLVPKNQ
ncbi:10362_t:CDS:1, partial [Racocetra persica]